MCADCETEALLAFICHRLNLGTNPEDIREAMRAALLVPIFVDHEPTHMTAGSA